MAHHTVIFLAVVVLGLSTLCSYYQVLPYTVPLISSALALVLIGSLSSLSLSPLQRSEDEDADCISLTEAMRLPVVASMALVVVYALLQRVGPGPVNAVAQVYFLLIGTICLKVYLKVLLDCLWPQRLPKGQFKSAMKVPITGKNLTLSFTVLDILSYVFSGLLAVAYYSTHHWALNNLFGAAFCVFGIEKTATGNFKTTAVLLIGLFVFDGVWVYATDVMETVAVGLEVPIKLLFPKSRWGEDMALLGLGDVIIPGLLVGISYRLDYFLSCKKERKGAPKYLLCALTCYFVGLLCTFLVMHQLGSGQASLPLLCCTMLSGLYLTSRVAREQRDLLNYKED